MASPAAPVSTLFGSAGGVGVGGRPAGTKTGGERTVDDGGAAVRGPGRIFSPTRI